jgi:hypothetical protein
MSRIPPAAPPRRHRPPVAAVIAASALLLVAAACGGSASSAGPGAPNPGGSAGSPSTLAYSACMRSHGVPSFPDPDSSGHLPKADAHHLGVGDSQLQAAQRTCRRLLPRTGASFEEDAQQCYLAGDCPADLVQQILTVQRRYARCIRAHGVPGWPDPTIDSQGRPYFDVSKAGLSAQYTRSQAFAAKDRECERLVSGSSGGVPVAMG